MIGKRFDLIAKDDIEALVTNQVPESRTLDYKEQLPGQSDSDKRDFLADVSAFANASGGDLLYGVKEKREDSKTTGIPENACGISGLNADGEIRRLENSIRDGIEPRIAGVQMKHIDGFENGPVLLIRVAKSWASPHMVTFKGVSRFYSRDNRGNFQLDVTQIRSAFALTENLAERVRRFRDDRLAKIVAGETPILDEPAFRVVLHLVPISALDPNSQKDVVLNAAS